MTFSGFMALVLNVALLSQCRKSFSIPVTFEAENSLRKHFLHNCNADTGFYGQQVNIHAFFYIYKLLEVEELNEDMTVYATLTLKWHDDCIRWDTNKTVFKDLNNLAKEQVRNLTHVSFPSEMTWKPTIVQLGTTSDLKAVENNGNHLKTNFFPNGYIEWSPTGRWTTSCEFSLQKFPFDVQTCVFAFELWDIETVTNFSSADAVTDEVNNEMVTSEVLIWRMKSVQSKTSRVCFPMSTPPKIFCSSTVRFSVTIERKSAPYIFSIFLPTICLTVLQLSPLAMPPQSPQRPCYSVTVLLAFAVINQLVQKEIPQTAEIINLVVFISFNIMIGTFCTVYSAVTVSLAQYLSDNKGNYLETRIFCNLKISKIRFVDLIVFIVLIILLLIANIVFFKLSI